ncbi:MAG: methyltransferase [bacterium]|nr:methyltransferase [bacterium]
MSYQVILVIPGTDEEAVSEELFGCGAGSVSVEKYGDGSCKLTAFCEDRELCSRIRDHFEPFIQSVSELHESQWKYKWLDGYSGFELIRDVYISPSAEEDPAPGKYSYVIKLDPRDAFGDGRHPTTAMCSSLLYSYLSGFDPAERGKLRLVDIGTGTGLLSILARKIGVVNIDLFDYDEDAVLKAGENLRGNGLLDCAPFCADLFSYKFPGKYDIILANLLTDIVLKNLPEMRDALAETGVMIISGIGDSWIDEVRDAFGERGLVIVEHLRDGGWNGFMLAHG